MLGVEKKTLRVNMDSMAHANLLGGNMKRNKMRVSLLAAIVLGTLGCGGAGTSTEAGDSGADAKGDMLADGLPGDGLLPDGGTFVPQKGPIPLLERLTPSATTLRARTYEDMLVTTFTQGQSGAPAGAFPAEVDVYLDPTVASSTPSKVALRWGVLDAGTLMLPPLKAVADFLGKDYFAGSPVTECRHVSDNKDIYGCRSDCRPVSGIAANAASTQADVQALIDARQEVRMLHPYMIAYPQDASGQPAVTNDRAVLLISQHATTPGDNGWGWAANLKEESGNETNDIESTAATWDRAWDIAARYGTYVIWIGDVELPTRWMPAQPRQGADDFGITCDTGKYTAWRDANTWVGLMNFVLPTAAKILGEQAMPDELLALGAPMPYMRGMSAGVTFLKRFVETQLPGAPVPKAFSVAGGSKGGMACNYTVATDPRVKLGVCSVWNIFDLAADTSIATRLVKDWGVCAFGGLDKDGCATGYLPTAPGEAGIGAMAGSGQALNEYRETWELAEFMNELHLANPGAVVWYSNASTDFHYPTGLNEDFWRNRAPDPSAYRLTYRMNSDHGMFHFGQDNGPEGLTLRDWSHSPEQYVAYDAFLTKREVMQVSWVDRPYRDGQMIRARARVYAPGGFKGAQAWIAASRDRDFHFCGGMENMGSDALLCKGEWLCNGQPQVSGAACHGSAYTESCPTQQNAISLIRDSVVLPGRPPSQAYCWWRKDDGKARPLWDQCVNPKDENLTPSSTPPYVVVRRQLEGTYGDLAVPFAGAAAVDPLPGTAKYRAFGAASLEAYLDEWGFIYPYKLGTSGDFRYWDSGMFMPRTVLAAAGAAANTHDVELAWPIPAGAEPDHFAVSIEAFSTPPAGDLPDIVYTDIAMVEPPIFTDADARTCN